MKCFNHRELDAIAVCKHCGRGICSDSSSGAQEISQDQAQCENCLPSVRSEFAWIWSVRRQLVGVSACIVWLTLVVAVLMAGAGIYFLTLTERTTVAVIFLVGGLLAIDSGLFFLRRRHEMKSIAPKTP